LAEVASLIRAALIVAGAHGFQSEDDFAGCVGTVVNEVQARFHEEFVADDDL
jgi:hypothetical protein